MDGKVEQNIQYVETKEKKSLKNGWFWCGVSATIGAIVAPFMIFFISGVEFSISGFQKLGTVGDFFGGTMVGLVSLAGVFFVVHAITMQRESLELQRKELAMQREELSLTRDEFKAGNETARVQEINNVFFNMLNLHNQIVKDVDATKVKFGSEVTVYGHEALREISKNNINFFNSYRVMFDIDFFNQEFADSLYDDSLKKTASIRQLLKNTYTIIEFIERNVANDAEEKEKIGRIIGKEPIVVGKKYYFDMLIAQMSSDEIMLTLLDSIYSHNKWHKYLILKNNIFNLEDENNQNPNVFKLRDQESEISWFKEMLEVEKKDWIYTGIL